MDPLTPAPPQPAFFDTPAQAWVFSRYADVVAALHEPALQQEKANTEKKAPHVRDEIFAALSSARVAQWQKSIEPAAHEIIGALPTNRPVDLLGEVICPWAVEVAILMLRDGPSQRPRLLRLARGRAESSGRGALRGKLANVEFELFFRKRPGDKSAFIGASETLPAFLANAWVALLRDPVALGQLRSRPELMPGAIEELLRYAGLVHSLTRQATSDVDIAGVRIAAGTRVILKLASANRDPQQFDDPNRLDVTRRPTGHLSLGHGEHSCVGAVLLRAASATLTLAFLSGFTEALINGDIGWRWGNTLVSPAALPALLTPQLP